jgi:hypothetical protein
MTRFIEEYWERERARERERGETGTYSIYMDVGVQLPDNVCVYMHTEKQTRTRIYRMSCRGLERASQLQLL